MSCQFVHRDQMAEHSYQRMIQARVRQKVLTETR
jgi:hypothetical protein